MIFYIRYHLKVIKNGGKVGYNNDDDYNNNYYYYYTSIKVVLTVSSIPV
jgi:hypothetical protein